MRLNIVSRHTHHVLKLHVLPRTHPSPVRSFLTSAAHKQQDKWILNRDDFQPRKSPNPQAKHVAIIGGGITGLSAAYELSRAIPDVKITVFEQSERLGGWLNSEVLDVGDGQVLFEWGPRSLRFTGGRDAATVEMLLSLDLQENIVGIGKRHPASQNRFVYYPDHLVRMPTPDPTKGVISNLIRNFYSFFNEPIFSGAFSSLLAEPAVAVRPPSLQDESVGSFLRRRFGPTIADNLASALFHGIYAGDIYKLSARALLPRIWYAEARDREGNGVITELGDIYMRGKSLVDYTDVRIPAMLSHFFYPDDHADVQIRKREDLNVLTSALEACSAYTFVDGLGTLPRALEASLQSNDNITIQTQSSVTNVILNDDGSRLSVYTGENTEPLHFDYAISSLSPEALTSWITFANERKSSRNNDPSYQNSCMQVNQSADVMVVNLYYSSPDVVPVRGFGYLLPQSIPADQNPERALGVIFSSESSGVRGPQTVSASKKKASDASIPHYTKDLHPKPPPSDQTGPVFKQFGAQKSPLLQQLTDKMRLQTEEQKVQPHVPQQNVAEPNQQTHEKQQRGTLKYGELRLGQDTAPGTKLTVMLGGHWWSEWPKEDIPSESEAIAMAQSVLARHLDIHEQPVVAKARLNRKAIPQYPVNYRQKMANIHEGLMDMYKGRVKVAGPWWQGAVGVNDCIRSARESVFAIREGWEDETGLKAYTKPEKWCLVDRSTKKLEPDPMCLGT